jgi:prolyl oligopeptidase
VDIPVTMIRHQAQTDPNGPILLMGYGGFEISLRPWCQSYWMPWLEAGGRVAVAHVRGGGERGPRWHQQGKGQRKQVSVSDFLSVARFLRQAGPSAICSWGMSNGGGLVLAAAVSAPELFAGVIAINPVVDIAKFHRFTDGSHWLDEYGDPDQAEDLRAIASWSPLHRLQIGTRYPPSLIIVAKNDERVDPMHGRKMTAALQATGSPGPHLQCETSDAGHGGGETQTSFAEQAALAQRFAAQSCGIDL